MLPDLSSIETRRVAPADPLLRPLLDGLESAYVGWYGEGARQEMTRYPLERFTPERGGAIVLLVSDGEAIAGGAYMREGADAEVKRMWTHPDWRRRGLAARVLAELERDAAGAGYSRMVLGTGRAQDAAVALYLSSGWTPDRDPEGDWRRDPGWLSFHKELTAS